MFAPTLACLALLFPQTPQGEALPEVSAGVTALQEQDWVAAAKVFRARVDANPKEAQSWYRLGLALHEQSKWRAALEAQTQAAGFPPTARMGSYQAARACGRLGQVDEGLSWLQKAVSLGWGHRANLASEPDLEALRVDKRFASLLPPLLEGAELFAEKPEVLHTLVGEAGGDQFGWVARVVGDLDGDGAMDFAATAPTHQGWSGAVYVHSGRTAELLFRLDGQPGWQLGNSVEGRVDVNGDGIMDVIAGAPNFGNNQGHVVVASGKDGQVLHRLSAGRHGDQFGMKVAGLPDLDGDQHDEVVVGAPGDGPGRVYVYSGKTGQLLASLSGEADGDQFGCSLDGTTAGEDRLLVIGAMKAGEKDRGRGYLFRFSGLEHRQVATIDTDEKGSNLGQYFAAFLGDVNGDSVSDAYLSDWNHANRGPNTGRAYVHCGQSGERILVIDGRKAGEGFGTSQATCGDVNGDGVADLCIGAWQNAEGAPSGGKIYVVSGKDGSDLATWTSLQAGDTLGFDAVGIGDVNGDGQHDFLVTAAWSTVQFGRQGRVFVIAGPALRS